VLAKPDLAARAIESYRRSERWMIRKSDAGIAGMMDVDANLRYAELRGASLVLGRSCPHPKIS